jgi:Tfp pilus assembly protein PilF
LDILYQRNLYVLAINLAQKAGLDASQQNVILRKFGDYLYSKQDYDTAMQQYLKAIDNTEPSQVIRKASSNPVPRMFVTNVRFSFWIHKGYTI